jgi:hypothetical protein
MGRWIAVLSRCLCHFQAPTLLSLLGLLSFFSKLLMEEGHPDTWHCCWERCGGFHRLPEAEAWGYSVWSLPDADSISSRLDKRQPESRGGRKKMIIRVISGRKIDTMSDEEYNAIFYTPVDDDQNQGPIRVLEEERAAAANSS